MRFQTLSIVAGTERCNANCPFCISKMTGKKFDHRGIDWINFNKACRLAQINNITNVIITGKGEPTLSPDQITDYLRRLEKYDFPIVELQTNGLALAAENYNNHLKMWRDLGLTIISISVVDYRIEKNGEIYVGNKQGYPNLGELVAKLHGFGYSVRLSCTLIRGYVDGQHRVRKMIEAAREWRVKQLTLRLVSTPEVAVDKKTKQWTEKHKLTEEQIAGIGRMLDDKGKRLATYDYGGALYDFRGQNVCFTNALTLKPNSEEVRQIMFFPDGHLRFDWQYEGAILF